MKTVTYLLLSAFLVTGCASMKKDCCDSKESCDKKSACCKSPDCKDGACAKKKG
ncbi:MAG: hypothetical protein ACLGG0_12265 [Bacteriovoracia bacterium]